MGHAYRQLFFYHSLVGFTVVLLFLPETAKLSLEELDMGKKESSVHGGVFLLETKGAIFSRN